MRAFVERDVHAVLGAGVEQPRPIRILAHDARVVAGRDAVLAVGDPLPRLAVVVGQVHVGREVVQHVAIRGDDRAAGVLRRQIDHVDRAPLRQTGRRDLRPVLAVVAREVQQPVVAAGPQQARRHRRFLEREDRVVDLDAGVVARDALAARVVLLRLVVAREIRADHVPGLPAVLRSVHELRRRVDDVGVVRRHADRRVPLEAVFHVGGALPGFLVGVDAHALADAAVAIGALDACRRSCRRR